MSYAERTPLKPKHIKARQRNMKIKMKFNVVKGAGEAAGALK
jgi:hypothetical protein